MPNQDEAMTQFRVVAPGSEEHAKVIERLQVIIKKVFEALSETRASNQEGVQALVISACMAALEGGVSPETFAKICALYYAQLEEHGHGGN